MLLSSDLLPLFPVLYDDSLKPTHLVYTVIHVTDYLVLVEKVKIETTYWQFMSDNIRSLMGALQRMGDKEHSIGIYLNSLYFIIDRKGNQK